MIWLFFSYSGLWTRKDWHATTSQYSRKRDHFKHWWTTLFDIKIHFVFTKRINVSSYVLWLSSIEKNGKWILLHWRRWQAFWDYFELFARENCLQHRSNRRQKNIDGVKKRSRLLQFSSFKGFGRYLFEKIWISRRRIEGRLHWVNRW